MQALPAEIVHQILLELSQRREYDALINIGLVSTNYQTYITAWQNELFTGMSWLAWYYTKPKNRDKFISQLVMHYGFDTKHNKIPNIRNSIYYSVNAVVTKFKNISKILRELLFFPPWENQDHISNYIKELNYLNNQSDELLKELTGDNYSKKIENTRSGAPTIAFITGLNRLNTVLCDISNLLTIKN